MKTTLDRITILTTLAMSLVAGYSREASSSPCSFCLEPIATAVVKTPLTKTADPVVTRVQLETTSAPLGGGRVRSALEYFSTLDQRFQPEASKGMHAVFQFNLTGANAVAYHVAIDDGKMTVEEGHADKANVTIGASAEDYVKVVNGDIGGASAVLGRKMSVGGSLTLARKLQKLFPGGQPDNGQHKVAVAKLAPASEGPTPSLALGL